ncbi:tyrosine-type recombinase/integrase [Porticoccaceae bacterium]|jgi:integrase|nr:tyrosine-type recombinase/integrase [Porticoccaceae bacterium]MDC1477050.1 tyrosine-type recombinase/integrase [Porticoccaceae bacterium]|tara:strand:+ start:2939 stop:4225 length:1287 start_codon:yes stop_codon:yes gene_type:complete
MANIILRGNTWHARLAIPARLRHVFNKREFTQSLKTSSKPVAAKQVIEIVANWRLEIAAASGNGAAIDILASELKQRIAEEKSRGKYASEELGMTASDAYADHYAESLPEHDQQRFYDVLTGRKSLPFNFKIIVWADQVYSNNKTANAAVASIERFSLHTPLLDDVTRSNIKRWLSGETRAKATVEKDLSFLRSYWLHLEDIGAVSEDNQPFLNIKLPDTIKNPKKKREPFTNADLNTLFDGIVNDKTVMLASLISLHTGARIAEVMALKISDVIIVDGIECLHIDGTKSHAAIRDVPIHPSISLVIEDLIADGNDRWLIPNTGNKQSSKSRGNAVGKRFGRLKTKMGFPSTKVFHSLRKSFVTACEQAGAIEGVVADIVGHEKQSMTFGVYSGGSSIKQRLEVMNTISFDQEIAPICSLKRHEREPD